MFQSKSRFGSGGSSQDPNTLYDDDSEIAARRQKGKVWRAEHHQNVADEKAAKDDEEKLRLKRIQDEKDRQAAMDNVANKASEGVQIQGALSDSQITAQPTITQAGNPTGALYNMSQEDIDEMERKRRLGLA